MNLSNEPNIALWIITGRASCADNALGSCTACDDAWDETDGDGDAGPDDDDDASAASGDLAAWSFDDGDDDASAGVT